MRLDELPCELLRLLLEEFRLKWLLDPRSHDRGVQFPGWHGRIDHVVSHECPEDCPGNTHLVSALFVHFIVLEDFDEKVGAAKDDVPLARDPSNDRTMLFHRLSYPSVIDLGVA